MLYPRAFFLAVGTVMAASSFSHQYEKETWRDVIGCDNADDVTGRSGLLYTK